VPIHSRKSKPASFLTFFPPRFPNGFNILQPFSSLFFYMNFYMNYHPPEAVSLAEALGMEIFSSGETDATDRETRSAPRRRSRPFFPFPT
jgi:hypothetical protein